MDSRTTAADGLTTLRRDEGLGNTIVVESAMCFIDGKNGVLEYVGIDIDTLARNSTFEETVYLLWHHRLPQPHELDEFTADIRAECSLPTPMWDMIKQLPPSATPTHALQTLVSALALHDSAADDISSRAHVSKAISVLAKIPVLIAGFDRHRKGLAFVEPDQSMSIAANFLKMLNGPAPTATMAKALDVSLILHAEHGVSASTFAAQVIVSTLSDLYSAITAAIGALKGPLHGGANEAVIHMLMEIGEIDAVDAFIRGKLERKERIMGFGHRVYKAFDPRATYLKTFAKQLAEDTGNEKLYELSRRIEEVMEPLVGPKGIHPNVDFYAATTLYSLGISVDLFTPVYAMSRVAGWIGHCIEQLADNRLIRPRAEYVGPHKLDYTPIDERDPRTRRGRQSIAAALYLDTDDPVIIGQAEESLIMLAAELGFLEKVGDDPEMGSWFRRFGLKSREALTSKEVKDRLQQAEYALKLKVLDEPLSNVDLNVGNAAAAVLSALHDIPNAACQIGSLLIVKTTNVHNEPAVAIRTLTPREMRCLEDHPDLLKSPEEILRQLEAAITIA